MISLVTEDNENISTENLTIKLCLISVRFVFVLWIFPKHFGCAALYFINFQHWRAANSFCYGMVLCGVYMFI